MCLCYITLNFSFKLPGLPTKFNGQIIRTDGKRIAEEMKAKMEVIFSENVLALKVILITEDQLRHPFILIPILSPLLTWPNYILEFTNKSGRRPERLSIPTKFTLKCHQLH